MIFGRHWGIPFLFLVIIVLIKSPFFSGNWASILVSNALMDRSIDSAKAEKALLSVIAQKPKDLHRYVQLALIYEKMGRNSQVAQAWKMSGLTVRDVLLLARGDVFSLTRVMNAQWYKRGLLIYPDSGDLLYESGMMLQSNHSIDLAYQHYLHAIQSDRWLEPEQGPSSALMRLGLIAQTEKRVIAAQSYYQQAVARKAFYNRFDEAETHYRLGEIYSSTNNLSKSIVELQFSLTLNPDHVWAMIRLARALYLQNETVELSEQLLKTALRIDPYNQSVYSSLVWLYFQADRPGDMSDVCVEMHKRWPDWAETTQCGHFEGS